MDLVNNKIIESFKINEDNNTIEVIFREPSNTISLSNPPQPALDNIWKEVYGVVNGNIELIDNISDKHIPGSYYPEKIEFSK